MRLTNNYGLPQAIVDAVKNDEYTKGEADISVTTLIAPPRKAVLQDEHKEQIVEDAADRIFSLMGQSIHTILERANRTAIAERRLSIKVDGWTISGGMDLYDEDGILTDYKVTSVYAVKADTKDEWIQQLNSYAEILRQHGHPVKGLKIVAILRDWSKTKSNREQGYPETQVVTIPLTLWTSEEALRFIKNRIALHKQARVKLPECSETERWAKPTVYAVMKAGRKSAVKLHDFLPQAYAQAAGDPNLSVVVRPGESTRCRFYCSVSQFCEQYQAMKAEPEEESA